MLKRKGRKGMNRLRPFSQGIEINVFYIITAGAYSPSGMLLGSEGTSGMAGSEDCPESPVGL